MNNGLSINTKILVNISLLIAMEVILRRFLSIATPIATIGFGFVPIAVCAIMYGPLLAGLAAAVSDIIGATLFPIGTFFPGFTLSAALTGIVFGLFLHKRSGNLLQLLCAASVNCLGVSLLITTYWVAVIRGTPYMVTLATRILPSFIMLLIQFTVLRLLQKPVGLYLQSNLYK